MAVIVVAFSPMKLMDCGLDAGVFMATCSAESDRIRFFDRFALPFSWRGAAFSVNKDTTMCHVVNEKVLVKTTQEKVTTLQIV